jgi:hypothetical protein
MDLAQMVFKQGQSGNPSGRRSSELKYIIESRELAVRASPDAIRTLINIMKNPETNDKIRVVACEKLLDRGMGRAIQYMDISTHENVDPKNMTREQLMLYLSGNHTEFVRRLRDTGKLKECLEELDSENKQPSQNHEFQPSHE